VGAENTVLGLTCSDLEQRRIQPSTRSRDKLKLLERVHRHRILRPCANGKTTAEIHDHHDEHTIVLAAALAKRAPVYTGLSAAAWPVR
jgi:predicted transcriptional regulator